jgi:hypothetical protein
MYDKKQDLVRPLKKRKAAPNQKFSDMPGPGGATPQVRVLCPEDCTRSHYIAVCTLSYLNPRTQ